MERCPSGFKVVCTGVFKLNDPVECAGPVTGHIQLPVRLNSDALFSFLIVYLLPKFGLPCKHPISQRSVPKVRPHYRFHAKA